MRTYEPLDILVEQANSNLQFEIDTRITVANLENTIRSVLSSLKINGEVVNVGSTNLQRFTAVLDPLSEDFQLCPDIDIYVVTPEKLHHERFLEVCELMDIGGFTLMQHSVPTFLIDLDPITAEVAFLSKLEEPSHAPLLYSRIATPLSGRQIADIKGFSLFSFLKESWIIWWLAWWN